MKTLAVALVLALAAVGLSFAACGKAHADPTPSPVMSYVKKSGDTMSGTLRSAVPSGRPAVAMAAGRCVVLNSVTAQTCSSGLYIDNDGTSTRIVNGGTPLLTVNNNTGVAAATGGFSTPANGPGDVCLSCTGTGWVQMAGNSSANIQALALSAGFGGQHYDDTNTRWRFYESTNWNAAPHFNPDGGAPFGLVQSWSGVKATNATIDADVAGFTTQLPVRGETLSFVPQVVGVGAGNAVVRVNSSGSGVICSGNVACTTAVGTIVTIACDFTVPAGTTRLEFDATACTAASSPIGTLTFLHHPVL